MRAFVNTRDVDKDTDRLTDAETAIGWLDAAGLLPQTDEFPLASQLSSAEGLASADHPTSTDRSIPTDRSAPAHQLAQRHPDDSDTLDRIVRVREAFRVVLVANADGTTAGAAVDTLNRVAAEAGITMRLSGPDSMAPVVAASGVEGALGRLVAIAFEAIADRTWSRLKACPADTCHWAFYDASRNRSSRWCDMSICGNRAKREALRRRRKHREVAS